MYLDAPLGNYITKPHARMDWTYDEATNTLCHSNVNGTVYEVYVARVGRMEMQSGQVYEKTGERSGQAPGYYHTSIVSFGEEKYKRHSKVKKFHEPDQPRSFLDTLRSFPNQGMWEGMSVDKDGEWILEALMEGTLEIAHDGSYQPEVTKDVCSTAILFRCRRTKRRPFAAFAEKSSDATS